MNNSTALLLGSIVAVIGLGLYVWLAFALGAVFAKLGEPRWKAWVPIVNSITIYRLGGYSALWVVALLLPVADVVAAVIMILALRGINRRFGHGGGFTALAFLALPIWASIIGFGPARVVDPSDEREQAPAFVPSLPPVIWAGPPVSAAGRPGSPTPMGQARPPAPFEVATPVVPAAPPLAESIAPPLAEPIAVTASPRAVWADEADSVVVDGATVITRRAPSFDDESDVEATVISARRVQPWVFETDEGQRVMLTHPVVLLGRNPSRGRTHPDAQLVVVTDAGKTVSKTHARIELVDGEWSITDLHSTNGVILKDAGGLEYELDAGANAALTEDFLLGELPARIYQERPGAL